MQTNNKIFLLEKLDYVPNTPGIYQFLDKNDNIIYIGKAKELKKRLKSYFKDFEKHTNKEQKLILQINDFKYILVETENEAFLLENSLIKKHQPRYNINLKDDKTYPYICITKEDYPKVFYTRKIEDKQNEYYGPFSSAYNLKKILELIKEIYFPRTCNLALTKELVLKNKFKLCLEYYINNCKAPCENKQSIEEYNYNFAQLKELVKGNFDEVLLQLKVKMQEQADKFLFEKAEELKNKITAIEKYQTRSTVVDNIFADLDIFTIIEKNDYFYVNYIYLKNRAIFNSYSIEIQKKLDEDAKYILELAIIEFRNKFKSIAKEIVVPMDVELEFLKLKITVPKLGEKKKLLFLSHRNLLKFVNESERMRENKNSKTKNLTRNIEKIKSDLLLNENPVHIECFDISNLQGTENVASCVVFKKLKPSKKDYRYFIIKTVEGQDDFNSMKEAVYRRYREEKNLPQLIIIDGGKGQLSFAYSSLKELGIEKKLNIISIAKKLEEIYLQGDELPIFIDKKSITLRIIQQLRDEAHRFANNFNRTRREKFLKDLQILKIKGIGMETLNKIIMHFKSLENLKSAQPEEVKNIIGKEKTEIILKYFEKNITANDDKNN